MEHKIESCCGTVVAVSASGRHEFSKARQASIRLLAGLGVEGDAHCGATTQHRYLMKKNPLRRNMTQVHLLHEELFAELHASGFAVFAGQLGENVTTRGVDLLELPVGARLFLGASAVVEVTGLREPCFQLDRLQTGLMKALMARDPAGTVVRKAGIMGVVLSGGKVRPGDVARVELPPKPWVAMGPV